MPEPHVFLTRPVSEKVMDLARESLTAELPVHAESDQSPSRESLIEGARGASALITMLTEKIDG